MLTAAAGSPPKKASSLLENQTGYILSCTYTLIACTLWRSRVGAQGIAVYEFCSGGCNVHFHRRHLRSLNSHGKTRKFAQNDSIRQRHATHAQCFFSV